MTYIHQAEARRWLFALRPEARAHGARGTARVDEEAALHLECLEPVSTAPKQDIHVHLPGCDQQRIGVTRRDDGVSVSETDAQAAVIYDLGEREVGGVNIVVTLDHLQVWGNLAEELIGIAIGEVSQAEDLADLAGGQEFAELERIAGLVVFEAIMTLGGVVVYLGGEVLREMG